MDKDDIEQIQAFNHLSTLVPCFENAFLFNKNLSPPDKSRYS